MRKRFFNLLCAVLVAAAQAVSPEMTAQTVTNVTARQAGNTVEVTYSLDKAAVVTLLLSDDGGQTYTYTPKALTGDVGEVQAGNNKIVWNLLQDGNDWDIARARFKVMAELKGQKSFTVNGVSFTMIEVEGGTFTMGCTKEQGKDCENDENPSHSVSLNTYYIGQTEVTVGLWKAVMGTDPSNFKKGDNYPVENVSWSDCQEFILKLNSLTGRTFALPTEAQWEYAARGGKKSEGYKFSGSNNIASVAWYSDNSGSTTHPVATKYPNELGLYDMTGNVWEWCEDWYGSYSSSAQTNPTGASSGSGRVGRGGCWYISAWGCRVSNRNYYAPSRRSYYIGFRLVLP